MPKPTEASSNSLRQATPELEIHGPTAHELPATRLTGETITLRATGGNGRYQWLTTAPEAVSIQHRQDDRCEVAIEGTAAAQILAFSAVAIEGSTAAPILAFSAGEAAIYKGLTGNRPLLKAVDNRPRHYLEAEQYCQKIGGSLPSKQTIEAILKARKTEVVAWAKKSFPVTLGTSSRIWLKAEATSGQPSINLETAVCFDHTEAIETKKNAIADQENSIQQLKAKEQALLAKGASLSEEQIKTTTEDAATRKTIEDGNFVHSILPEGGISNILPDSKGMKIIEEQIEKALTKHREKQTAISNIREQLHMAQGDIKRQWEELTELKIQQAKEGVTTYTLCQFNPASLDQAVASWVPDEGEATPGDRFTTGQCAAQRSAASAQLSHCQFNS